VERYTLKGPSGECISKIKFCLGGVAPWKWTPLITAVNDTPVADFSVPSVNTTCRIAYRPLIPVEPSPLVLMVSYSEWSLWRCHQLWPYVGMVTLGTRWHRDCNVMGDAAKISPCVPSTCAQNAIFSLPIIHIIPTRKIYLAIDNPSLLQFIICATTSSYLWN